MSPQACRLNLEAMRRYLDCCQSRPATGVLRAIWPTLQAQKTPVVGPGFLNHCGRSLVSCLNLHISFQAESEPHPFLLGPYTRGSDSTTKMCGLLGDQTMEMNGLNGGSAASSSYLARTPCVSLFSLCCTLFQKKTRAHKNKIGTSSPQSPKYPPPLKRGILWACRVSCRKNAIFPGTHRIDAAISGPRIAAKHFTDMRLFLTFNTASNGP